MCLIQLELQIISHFDFSYMIILFISILLQMDFKTLLKWLDEKEEIQKNQALSHKYFKCFSIGIINMIYVQTYTCLLYVSLQGSSI